MLHRQTKTPRCQLRCALPARSATPTPPPLLGSAIVTVSPHLTESTMGDRKLSLLVRNIPMTSTCAVPTLTPPPCCAALPVMKLQQQTGAHAPSVHGHDSRGCSAGLRTCGTHLSVTARSGTCTCPRTSTRGACKTYTHTDHGTPQVSVSCCTVTAFVRHSMSGSPDAPTPGRSSGRLSPSPSPTRTTSRASPESDTEREFPPKLKFAEPSCIQATAAALSWRRSSFCQDHMHLPSSS